MNKAGSDEANEKESDDSGNAHGLPTEQVGLQEGFPRTKESDMDIDYPSKNSRNCRLI